MKPDSLTKLDKRTMITLAAAVFITCLAVFHQYMFGNKVLAFIDIGSDTAQQYLAQYAIIIRKMQTGDFSLWSQDYGMGGSLYMLNMFNPLLIILYIIGAVFGFGALPHVLVWWFVAEIVGAALCAYVYLSIFGYSEKIKAIAGYMYAFNGFLIVWGQHYQFGIVCLFVPLMLWACERCIRDKRKWPFLVVITAIVVFNSMYLAYMTLLMAAFYVCVRVYMYEKLSFAKWFAKCFSIAVPMIVGLMIGGISLLPSFAAIANVSARLNSDSTLWGRLSGSFHYYGSTYYKSLADSLLSETGEGINVFFGYLNYYESPNIFFSGLFVFLAGQYVCGLPTRKESRRRKMTQAILIIVAAAGLYFPAAGVIFNGFTAPFSRYTFLYMPYFLLITAYVLKEILEERKVCVPAVLLALLFMGWRYYMMFISSWPNSRKAFALAALAALAMGVLLILRAFDKTAKWEKHFLPLLLILLAVNVTVETYSDFAGRDALDKDGLYLEDLKDQNTREALAAIKASDDGLYRVEKLFGASFCMDGLFQDYHQVSVYNSTQNRYIIDFVNNAWESLYYLDDNHYSYANSDLDPENSGLTGVRYILDRGTKSAISGFEKWQTFGDLTVWKSTEEAGYVSYYENAAVSGSDDNCLVTFSERERDAILDFKDPAHESRVQGQVSVSEDGLLVMAMPYEEGWEVSVDGVRADLLKANYGFQAVRLEAGNHEVSFVYRCPLFKEGTAMTLVGILLFAGALIIARKKRRAA